MKRSMFIVNTLLLMFSVFVFSSCSTVSNQSKISNTVSNQNKIVGTWSDGEKLSYVFDKDGYATIRMGEQIMGGSDLFGDSVLKYEIDFSKDPITLDLVHMYKSTKEERNRMAMIVKFVTDNQIHIKTHHSKKRPEKFEENDENILILDRALSTDKEDK